MTQSIDLDSNTLVANCDARWDVAARSMLDALAAMHRRGPRLKPGSQIDFGWAILQIEAHPDHWAVCEPDYSKAPLEWKPQVDETIWTLNHQAALHAKLPGVAVERTRGDQQFHLAPDALFADIAYLHRLSPSSAQDSGWYAATRGDLMDLALEQTQPVMAGSLLEVEPEWTSVLNLPVGFVAQFDHDRLVAVFDAQRKQAYP